MRGMVAGLAALLVSCAQPEEARLPVDPQGEIQEPGPAGDAAPLEREIRLTGVVEAVRSSRIVVPQLSGQTPQLTLTRLIPNGTEVQAGDVIAEFDPIQQYDEARTAAASYDDLSHQVQQKAAENRANSEKRRSDLRQAEADLSKAQLEVSKAPILGDIAKQENAIRAERAQEQVRSLEVSNAAHDEADAAALRILELQRDRQKVALERAQSNIDKMQLVAPLGGMVAHSVQYRNGSMVHAQEGDQLYRGNALVSIFDPTEMLVRCAVGEPDGDILAPGVQGTVYFDAYPDLALPAHFESASPIATTALGSPIRTFTAIFRLDETDSRLMPDLSAAVVLRGAEPADGEPGAPESTAEASPKASSGGRQ